VAFGVASRWGARLAAVALAALLVALASGLAPGTLRTLDDRGSDLIWRLAPLPAEERRLIIVDIDEASLAKVGAWPWPRPTLADLSRRIAALGARLQVFDIVFPDARPGDAEFTAALQGSGAVLAQIFALDAGGDVAMGRLAGALHSPPCKAPMPKARGYIGNTPGLLAAAVAVGHLSPRIAPDGAVRSIPALVCAGDVAYPTLGLAAVVAGAGLIPAWELQPASGWLAPQWTLRHPGLPGIAVPLDRQGDVRVSYRLPRDAFVSVPAADVLAGTAPADLFRGAWVLIGATAFGVGDAVPTPLGSLVGGVEVHAQFIAGLLDSRLPVTPAGTPWLLLLLAAAGAALLLAFAALRGRLPVYGLPIAGVVLLALCFGLHAALVLLANLWLGWIQPALFLALSGVFIAVAEHAWTRFERERVFANLSSYLPAQVAREVALAEPSGRIDARRCETAVLVADLRNFSAYCEGRPPEEAAALLHAFFSRAVRIIEGNGGVVEGFQGDAVIGVWGAADPTARHVRRAFAAARQLLAEVPELFPDPPPEGLEPLAIGVGLETGMALVGSVGPATRRHHAVMGDTVTVALRLQAMTAELAQPLLVGPGAARQLESPELVSLGEFLLEGLRRSYTLYALRPEDLRAS